MADTQNATRVTKAAANSPHTGLCDRVQAVIFADESGVVTIGHNPAAGR